MSKKLIGIFYVISILLIIVGVVLIVMSIPGGTTTTNAYGGTTSTPGNGGLFTLGLVIALLAIIPMLVAWIGAIINVVKLQQWIWLVFLIIFSGITLLVYLFAGPNKPASNVQPQEYSAAPPNSYS